MSDYVVGAINGASDPEMLSLLVGGLLVVGLEREDLPDIGPLHSWKIVGPRYEDYRAYLRSPEWGVVRRIALHQADHRCSLCNRNGRLDVHHRTYDHIGRETLADVIVLCRGCHSRYHGVGDAS